MSSLLVNRTREVKEKKGRKRKEWNVLSDG